MLNRANKKKIKSHPEKDVDTASVELSEQNLYKTYPKKKSSSIDEYFKFYWSLD